jgi:hypothetical protein
MQGRTLPTIALLVALLADFWHLHQVASAARTGGIGMLFVTAPVAFLTTTLTAYLWFYGLPED